VITFLILVGWSILFVLCWSLAVLALLVWPIVWLVSIAIRLVGIGVGAVLALIKSILFLPVRMRGYRG
jgi:hypothetical protein